MGGGGVVRWCKIVVWIEEVAMNSGRCYRCLGGGGHRSSHD